MLAWRNVWRNVRRTGLTVAATVFAVVVVVFFVALADGVHEKMIDDSVRVHSGHLSVSGERYLENRTLEEFVRLDAQVEEILETTEGVLGFAPRVNSFALLSADETTHGVAVIGVDPDRESSVSTLAQRVRHGSFVSTDQPNGIVLGGRLARRLSTEVGAELLLYSAAYTLETAYDLFTVVGISKLPDPELDRNLAVISLRDAQSFFEYGDRVSEIAVLAADSKAAAGVAETLRSRIGAYQSLEVHTWKEIMPDLAQFIFLDDAGMYVMLVILVVVVAFGIFNTILMSVLERQREFGVLLALGLRPRALFRLVFVESLLLAGVGLSIGLVAGLTFVLYLQANPIPLTDEGLMAAFELIGAEPVVTWKLAPANPLVSTITVFAVAVAAAVYPAIKASRGRPVDVLRGL